MSEHSHTIGGSSCERVMHCPGSVALSAAMPARPSSTYADQGTMLHSVMQLVLESDKTPEELIGYQELGHTLTVDLVEEMIRPALACFDELVKIYGEIDYVCEAKVRFEGTDAFGTADILGCNDTYTLVVDWKFGRGVAVTANRKWYQGYFYAAGGTETPSYRDMFDPNKPIVLAVIQPAMDPPVTHVVLEHQELVDFAKRVREAVARVEDDDKALLTGKWCRWCDAKPTCPAKTRQAADLALSLPTDVIKAETGKRSIDSRRLGELVHQADEMEDWTKSVKALAHAELEIGHDVRGFKLVKKRATRQWVDDDAAEALFRKARILVRDFMTFKMVSPPQAEKMLKAKKKTLDLGELIVSRSSGTTMVADDDKRPAVRHGANGLALPPPQTRQKGKAAK